MDTIRADLRSLIAKYGLQAIHTELQAEMKETYEFLRHQFEPPKNNLVIPVSSVIPNRAATPHLNPMKNIVCNIEPPSLELSSIPQVDDATRDETINVPTEEAPRDPSLKEVIVQAKKEMSSEGGEKFSKAKHREMVAEKHKELIAKGVKPDTLLTKENLSLWLSQGMSYMRIAREYVGIPENEISVIAKTFGLQSDIKKYIVMKKTGK